MRESDFATRTLPMILDSRIEECSPVFITSNLSTESLGHIYATAMSRPHKV